MLKNVSLLLSDMLLHVHFFFQIFEELVGQLFTCLFYCLYMSAFCVASYAGYSVFALECLFFLILASIRCVVLL
jgi:hypothetical protein